MRALSSAELRDVIRRVVAEAGQQRRLQLGTLRTSGHDMTRRDARQKLDVANRRIRAMQQIERDLLRQGGVMPTANHEVTICRCGHGDHEHKLGGQAWPDRRPCTKCPCSRFDAAPTQNLKEGEQLRRITED